LVGVFFSEGGCHTKRDMFCQFCAACIGDKGVESREPHALKSELIFGIPFYSHTKNVVVSLVVAFCSLQQVVVVIVHV
jgi:hypothetical protein